MACRGCYGVRTRAIGWYKFLQVSTTRAGKHKDRVHHGVDNSRSSNCGDYWLRSYAWSDARLEDAPSLFGIGQSGRGPSSLRPIARLWDEAAKVSAVRLVGQLAAVQALDPSQGWWDEQTKVSAVRLVMANLAAVQAPSTYRKAGDEADQSVGSPFGNGQSGRGPSPFDPSQGWWDEADQSVGRRLIAHGYIHSN